VVGSVQEEDCDGLCWQYIVKESGTRPEAVVLTEPTNLGVHRGQRGRMEMDVSVKGVSCHGSAPERGVNAATRAARIALEVEAMNASLGDDPFLGRGSVAVTQLESSGPSLCAVPDAAGIHLDRRLTLGETPESALEAVKALPSVRESGAEVSVPLYEKPTHTGLVYPTRSAFPAWVCDEAHPLVRAALKTAEATPGARPKAGRWVFSTNGVATAGLLGIPSVGFGPGDEAFAHGPEDQVPVDHLVSAAVFYALLPWIWAGEEE
jgi:putative selenium metabolism hydrolase